MIQLPADLETRLRAHEERRDDAEGARGPLEEAVTLQLRAVADGLLADLLLRGGSVPGPVWWQQFLSREERPPQYHPDLKNSTFRAYRQAVAQRIATGQIRPISVADLEEVLIRIYGGRCRLIEEGRINRQLAGLGSSLRLLVIGSQRNRADRARLLLGKAPKKKAMPDGRFIFGQVGPISVFNGAALFLFEREWAVSPYMEPGVNGLINDARIAIRQTDLRACVEQMHQELRTSPSDEEESPPTRLKRIAFEKDGRVAEGEEMLQRLTWMTLVHESQHIADLGERISRSRHGVESWQDAIREDLLRFAQLPRSRSEVESAFADFFPEGEFTAHPGPAWEVPRPEDSFSLDQAIETLRSDGLLLVDGEGRFFSTLYGPGQQWTV